MAPPEPLPEVRPEQGLARDLPRMDALVARRRALGWIVGAGAGTFTLLPAQRAASAGRCLAFPTETAGPYPGNGSNRASGVASNVLAAQGIVRSDIRASFIGSSRIATGVPLDLALTIVDAAGCAPLAGHAAYVWQADAQGLYSLYTAPEESYLRGLQASDAQGRLRFRTIVPGCYAGRYPHLHVQIFASLAAAVRGAPPLLTTQLVIPEAMSHAVYGDVPAYPGSAESFARFSLDRDYVFRDNSDAERAAMTIVARGSPTSGYSGSATIAMG